MIFYTATGWQKIIKQIKVKAVCLEMKIKNKKDAESSTLMLMTAFFPSF